MKKLISLYIFLIAFFTSCINSTNEKNKKSDLIVEANVDSNKIEADSNDKYLTQNNTDTILKNNGVISVKDWKMEDFIIKKKDQSNKELRRNIENEREEWKNVKNPFVATYRGCDIGDYFHLTFEDANGKMYDFGFGNNHFVNYLLYDKNYDANPKYLDKSFNVYWNWEISTFPCCDGEYEMVEAYLPSITKLELTGTNTNKK